MNPFLLADIAVTPQDGVMVALAVACTFLVVKMLFRVDDKIEERRKAGMDLFEVLTNWGFVRTPEFVRNYVVGDYSGMLHELRSAVKAFANKENVVRELQGVFKKMLAYLAKDNELRPWLLTQLKDNGFVPAPEPPLAEPVAAVTPAPATK
jgi:hypothetical protein